MKLPKPDFKMEYVPLEGGEDLVTPILSVKPGRAIFTQNYELDVYGRYRLIDGYEVFDGRPKPSEASYWILNFDQGSTEIEVEDTITGDTDGVTSEVLVVVLEDGAWADGDAAGYLVVFNLTGGALLGVYSDNEVLTVGGNPVAVANGTDIERGAATDRLDSEYLILAIEATRADIDPLPQVLSPVLGVWQYNGVKYAFQEDGESLSTFMYKSSANSWIETGDLRERMSFLLGTSAFVPTEVITQGGVSATVSEVIVVSGDWATNDAAGYLIITNRAGGHFSATPITGNIAGAASAAGTGEVNAGFPEPGGRFEFINYNFGGHAGTVKMYGCDGKNPAFEWDGTTFTQIDTGMTTDAPTHITAFRNHLFLAFAGGSIQHSSIGDPHSWSAVTGASEIGMGDEVTGFLPTPDSLVIFTRNSTKVLYGESSATWDLRPFSDESGAVEWTVQSIGEGIYLDDRGLTSLSATQKFGDFQANVISKYIQPYLKDKIGEVQGSVRVKEKNQYRLFFTDKRAITMTMDGNKVLGFCRQLYDVQITCICSTENSDGEEEIYFGASDGFVYQMDAGTSFNGNAIEAFLRTHFNHLKSPSVKKRIRKIVLELDAPIDSYISANLDFDYGDTIGNTQIFNPESPAGFWDVSNWDAFHWDGKSTDSAPLNVEGSGLNFGLSLYHSGEWELQDDEESPRTGLTNAGAHTIQGYIVHYDLRGVQR